MWRASDQPGTPSLTVTPRLPLGPGLPGRVKRQPKTRDRDSDSDKNFTGKFAAGSAVLDEPRAGAAAAAAQCGGPGGPGGRREALAVQPGSATAISSLQV